MPRVIHFEIYGQKPEDLIDFYGKIFNWKFEKWGPMDYWIIKTGDGPGIDGGLGKEQSPSVNTIDVPDVDRYLEKIVNVGGIIVTPKMTLPGIGYLAYFKDPQGNIFGIMKDDPNAKLTNHQSR